MGPTPNTSVTLVWAATLMRRREAAICSSRRRRSARCSRAKAWRAASMALVGTTASSMAWAEEAVISWAVPPATSSDNRACRRQAVRLRARPRSQLRLASRRSTPA